MASERNSLLTGLQRAVVLGGGVTGQETAAYLAREDLNVLLSDSSFLEEGVKERLEDLGVEVEEGGHTRRILDGDLIVISPGVPLDISLLEEARLSGIPVIGEIELAYRLSCSDRIVAVTGTNGKTTTVRLIAEILKEKGERVCRCGNIGDPFIGAVDDLSRTDVPVLEVSSYQLETIEQFKPKVGVLLNIAPDHLKRHGGMEGYKRAKFRLFENQGPSDFSIVNRELLGEVSNIEPEIFTFDPDDFRGYGLRPHNRENLAAAVKAVECILGDNFEEGWISDLILKRATDVDHRLETVTTVHGVIYVNDSKATNPHAAAAALESFQRPVHLLLGGRMKRGGYEPLVEKVKGDRVESVYLFGEAAGALSHLFSAGGYEDYEAWEDMEGAVNQAAKRARRGDVILLSPACSSFDAYQNFEDRGEKFRAAVRKIEETQSGTD